MNVLPKFYNLLICLSKSLIFVPKDVLKIIFDLMLNKEKEYWYHGTTGNSCEEILKYGVRGTHGILQGQIYANTGFYITNNYKLASSWAKFKANDVHKAAVIVFRGTIK